MARTRGRVIGIPVLTDEAFFLVVFLFACGLLALGSLELVWPTRPRHPVRRRAVERDPWRRARPRSVPPAARPEPDTVEPTPTAPVEATVALVPVTVSPPVAESAPLEITGPSSVGESVPLEVAPAVRLESSPAEESVEDRCFALLAADRFAEAIVVAEEALQAMKSTTGLAPSAAAAQQMTRLWGALGLARQGFGDFDGARFAFEEAMALAPQTERQEWERRLTGLASTAARRSLDEIAAGPARAEHVETVRSAIDWLERALMAAPDDAALGETLVAARETLWRTNEEVVKALIRRKAFAEAQRRLDDVTSDPDCPPERQRALRALHARAMAGDVGAAMAEAARHLKRGGVDDAMAALARAESAMAQIAGGLTAKRRQEFTHRLWVAYMKIGIDRLEAGASDAALGPLGQALRLDGVGDERLEETRATLVKALEHIVETRSVELRALAAGGDAGLAAIQADKLWSLLRAAVDQGLPQDRLTEAFTAVEALFAPKAPPVA